MNRSPSDMGLIDAAPTPEREQINAWKAVEFALEHIDDHYDRAEFLRECMHGDMVSIADDWPEFVDWIRSESRLV